MTSLQSCSAATGVTREGILRLDQNARGLESRTGTAVGSAMEKGLSKGKVTYGKEKGTQSKDERDDA